MPAGVVPMHNTADK